MTKPYTLTLPEYGFEVTMPAAPQGPQLTRDLVGYPGLGTCVFREFRAPPPRGRRIPDVYVEIYATPKGERLAEASRRAWLDELTSQSHCKADLVVAATISGASANRLRGPGDGGLHEVHVIEARNSVVLLHVVDESFDTQLAQAFFGSFRSIDAVD